MGVAINFLHTAHEFCAVAIETTIVVQILNVDFKATATNPLNSEEDIL